MTKKTVHVIIKDGMVYNAFADTDIDLVVYDLDTDDPDMRAEVQGAVDDLMRNKDNREIEIL